MKKRLEVFSEGGQLHCRGVDDWLLPTGDVIDCGPKCFGSRL